MHILYVEQHISKFVTPHRLCGYPNLLFLTGYPNLLFLTGYSNLLFLTGYSNLLFLTGYSNLLLLNILIIGSYIYYFYRCILEVTEIQIQL